MTSRLTEVSVDCHDPALLAGFWCQVLDYHVWRTEDDQVEIGPSEREPSDLADQIRSGPTPPSLVFVVVPENKAVKNRLHLDVRPVDRTHDEEVDRILGLGARPADVGQGAAPWTVLADPEGNEFCVLGPLPG
jgi:Glyoxalase-like domain